MIELQLTSEELQASPLLQALISELGDEAELVWLPAGETEGSQTRGLGGNLLRLLLHPRNLGAALDGILLGKEQVAAGGYVMRFGTTRTGEIVHGPNDYDPQAPTLLLLHGTLNTAKGSFGRLGIQDNAHVQPGTPLQPGSPLDTLLAEGAYAQILAFNHPTLTHTAEENLAALLRFLPRGLGNVDIVAGSRGGILARFIASDLAAVPAVFSQPRIDLNRQFLTRFAPQKVAMLPYPGGSDILRLFRDTALRHEALALFRDIRPSGLVYGLMDLIIHCLEDNVAAQYLPKLTGLHCLDDAMPDSLCRKLPSAPLRAGTEVAPFVGHIGSAEDLRHALVHHASPGSALADLVRDISPRLPEVFALLQNRVFNGKPSDGVIALEAQRSNWAAQPGLWVGIDLDSPATALHGFYMPADYPVAGTIAQAAAAFLRQGKGSGAAPLA